VAVFGKTIIPVTAEVIEKVTENDLVVSATEIAVSVTEAFEGMLLGAV
jgi:hypothetical protein